MKKIFILIALMFFFAASSAMAFSNELSYASTNGDICLADEAVSNVGLGDPTLHYTSQTGTMDQEMNYNESTGMWCANIGRPIRGRIAYAIEYNYSNMFFPHEYVKMGQIQGHQPGSFNPKEPIAVDNNGGGFNVVTLPIEK